MQAPSRPQVPLLVLALSLSSWSLSSCAQDHGDQRAASQQESGQGSHRDSHPDSAQEFETAPEESTPDSPREEDSAELGPGESAPSASPAPSTTSEQEPTPPSDVALPEQLRKHFVVEDPSPEKHGGLSVPRSLRHIATGLIFLYVPGGSFTFGSDADDPDRFDDERPPRRVRVTGFYLSATETTLAAWRKGGGEAGYGIDDTHPVNGINWYEARDWCSDNGLALPTEAQWEYAASGSRNDLFPWGFEERIKGRANAAGTNDVDLWLETSPVESFPDGTSWCGAVDLAGNVMEWCRDEWTRDHGDVKDGATDPVFEAIGEAPTAERLVRGGSFETDSLTHLRGAYRNSFLPSLAGANLGFRAVIPAF